MNRTSQGKWLSLAMLVIACGSASLVGCNAGSDAPADINPQPLPPKPGEDEKSPEKNDDRADTPNASSSGGGSSGTATSPDAGTDGSDGSTNDQ